MLSLLYSILAGFGLTALVMRVARDRDRSPYFWGAISLGGGIGIVYGGYLMLQRADFGDGVLTPAILILLGPVIMPGIVMLILYRLPAAHPRAPSRVAVRVAGEEGHLAVDDDGIRIEIGSGARRIARPDLARIEADGECLILELRPGGDQLRLQIIGVDDSFRRRGVCAALATSLTRSDVRAQVRTGRDGRRMV